MSDRRPDFDELVGDVDESERDRLHRVHELLLAAGPPPELPESLSAPAVSRPVRHASRRRGRLLALAAALGLTIFALGILLGDRLGGPATFDTVTMTGTADAAEAHASITLLDADSAGNWPMELTVEGLAPSASGRPYELWLTRDGRLSALCGSFLAEPDGSTTVPMNAPYRLRTFDGWVIVEQATEHVLLTT